MIVMMFEFALSEVEVCSTVPSSWEFTSKRSEGAQLVRGMRPNSELEAQECSEGVPLARRNEAGQGTKAGKINIQND